MTHFSFKTATNNMPPAYDNIAHTANHTYEMPPPSYSITTRDDKSNDTRTRVVRTYYDDNSYDVYEKYYVIYGRIEGQYKSYYKNGQIKQIKQICEYENNLLHGQSQLYDENGQLREISNYKYGQLNGQYSKFDGDGKLEYECVYNFGIN